MEDEEVDITPKKPAKYCRQRRAAAAKVYTYGMFYMYTYSLYISASFILKFALYK